jgi:hypothetical protein
MCYYYFPNPHNFLNVTVVTLFREDHRSITGKHARGGVTPVRFRNGTT